jgi:hypothetical protein
MTAVAQQAGIHCPIGLFERQEPKIAALVEAINAAQGAPEKVPTARMVIDEVHVLLDCASYDRGNANCRLCQSFSELRMKTARLIARIGVPDAAS